LKANDGLMKVYNNNRGAITVFLIMIFLSLLMLAGLFVDISRVMAAERNVHNALDTAVRSVLAQYDAELVGQFGLFAVSTVDKKEELERYFRVNLEEQHKNFNFINYEISKVEISSIPQQSMLNNEAFKKQILEYMKYKGPLLITDTVVDVFLQGSFEKKADLLETAKDATRKLKDIEQVKDSINDNLKRLTFFAYGSTVEKLVNVESIKKSVEELQELIAQTEDKTEEANAQITEIKEQMNQLSDQGENLQNIQGFEDTQNLEKLKDDLEQMLAELEHNHEIYKQIAALEKEAADLEDDDYQEKMLIHKQQLALEKQLYDLNLLSFTEQPELDSLSKDEADKKDGLRNKLEKLTGPKITETNPITFLIKQEDLQKANAKISEEDGVTDFLFEVEEQMGNLSGDNNHTEELSENVFNYLRQVTQQLQRFAADKRNDTYVTEYILDKYTFVTSPVSRGHFFDKGDVEYILCGHDYEIKNITDVFFRVWGMRYALNAVDAFLLNPLPSFIARLAKALVQGFIWATADMIQMFAGHDVPVCASLAKVPVGLGYSDHLRLLLLLQNEDTQLERMRQLMQINIRQEKPDSVLKNYATIVTGKAEVTVNLWFAPLLQLDKFGFRQINGNKYQLCITSTQGY